MDSVSWVQGVQDGRGLGTKYGHVLLNNVVHSEKHVAEQFHHCINI